MVELHGKNRCAYCFAEGGACRCAEKENPAGALRVGTILMGRYLVGSERAHTEVIREYNCYDNQTDRAVVLKELYPTALAYRDRENYVAVNEEDSGAYQALAQAYIKRMKLSMLSPLLFEVNESFLVNNGLYCTDLSNEWESLAEYVYRHGTFNEQEACNLLATLFEAEKKLYEINEAHGNINDRTVFFGNGIVRLGGFEVTEDDLASVCRASTVSRKDWAYVSRQSLSGGGRNGAADFYAIGAVTYFALTGQKPTDAFDRDDGRRIRPEVLQSCRVSPKMISALLALCNSNGRASLNEMMQAVNTALAQFKIAPVKIEEKMVTEDIPHTASSVKSPDGTPVKRKKGIVLIVLTAVLALICIAFAAWCIHTKLTKAREPIPEPTEQATQAPGEETPDPGEETPDPGEETPDPDGATATPAEASPEAEEAHEPKA